jgi:hypothetical protein
LDKEVNEIEFKDIYKICPICGALMYPCYIPLNDYSNLEFEDDIQHMDGYKSYECNICDNGFPI